MTPQDYEYLRKLLKERSGLVLGRGQAILCWKAGCCRSYQKGGFGDLTSLIAALRATPSSPLVNTVVEGMTTNEVARLPR